jgi:hypothetical protein
MSAARVLPLWLGAVLLVAPAWAQQAARPGLPAPPPAPAGTPLPEAPVGRKTIARDAYGRATIRAVRATTPLRIDGKLDEPIYQEFEPVSDFIQNDPVPYAPATEKTEVWIFFDEKYVYVTCRCWESDMSKLVANEMRRDNTNIVQSDQFAFSFDTFHDRRNVLLFEISAVGGRIDGQVTNERQISLDWNPIWYVKTAYFDKGYIVEARVPWKSLRYAPGANQPWGVQLRRRNMAKNEYSYVVPIPPSVGGQGHFRAALAAELVGLEPPRSSRNLDVKPYVRGDVSSDRLVRPAVSNKLGGDVGVDMKYAVTQGLLADITVNTDFAQVEADEQQVNLTRFSLFFPEKRDFFLENGGLFAFAATNATANVGSDVPLLFYSRAIGFSAAALPVPLIAGGRLSGRQGAFTIGALNVQSVDDVASRTEATNFSVLRVRRDLFGRNNVGMILTHRSVGSIRPDPTTSWGVDSSWAFGPDFQASAYWAQAESGRAPRTAGAQRSYRGYVDYNADRWGLQYDHLAVGRFFNPEVGFVRRPDMRKNAGLVRFSPRPKRNRRVRKYLYSGSFSNTDNYTTGRLESRLVTGSFEIQYQNQDVLFAEVSDQHEFLPAPFRIAPTVTLPVGDYGFQFWRAGYNFGRQRNLSGNISFEQGAFYDGNKTTFSVGSGRLNFGPRLSMEPAFTLNNVEVSTGSFTQRLVTSRVTFTLSPWAFTTALVQYNRSNHTLAANIRFRWEYIPGSEFFIVYNDQRDTLNRQGFPDLQNRALIVKLNRVFRY